MGLKYLTAKGEPTIYPQDESYAQSFVRYVKEDLQDIAHRYIKIGFRLSEASKFRYYEELGFNNIIELAEALFGFKKSTTYGLMQVYHYCRSNDKNDVAWAIEKKYEDYDYSQLLEISRLKWGGGEHLIKPSDSVDKIKQFVRAWNKDGERSNATGCKTIDDYMRKTGRLTEAESATLSIPGLLKLNEKEEVQEEQKKEIFQTSGKIKDEPTVSELSEPAPEVIDCELVEEPETDVVDGEDNSQHDEPKKRPESEIIKVGLVGVDIYVKDAKFRIYDRYRNEPLKGDFSEFIKSVYNYDNKPNFTHGFYSEVDNMNRSYEDKGIQFISFDPFQQINLTWEEVARHISDLIYTDEYLNADEHEKYLKWKADNEGLVVNVVAASDTVEPELHTPSEEAPAVEPTPKTKQNKTLKDYLFCLPTEEVVNKILMKILKIFPLKGQSSVFMSTVRQRLIEWFDTPEV